METGSRNTEADSSLLLSSRFLVLVEIQKGKAILIHTCPNPELPGLHDVSISLAVFLFLPVALFLSPARKRNF